MGTPQTNTLQSGHWFCTACHKLDPPYPEAITMVGLDGRYKAYLFISSSIVCIRLLLGCYAVAWFLCLQFFNHQWWRKCFVRLFLNGVTKFSWVLDFNKYLSICRLGEKSRPLTINNNTTPGLGLNHVSLRSEGRRTIFYRAQECKHT